MPRKIMSVLQTLEVWATRISLALSILIFASALFLEKTTKYINSPIGVLLGFCIAIELNRFLGQRFAGRTWQRKIDTLLGIATVLVFLVIMCGAAGRLYYRSGLRYPAWAAQGDLGVDIADTDARLLRAQELCKGLPVEIRSSADQTVYRCGVGFPPFYARTYVATPANTENF